MDYKQIKAIEYKNKQRWLAINHKLTDDAGIYILTRTDENGFRYAYIGQAKHLLTRLASHLVGYQHIDLSLRKHGLYSTDNKNGWEVVAFRMPESLLNQKEQEYIKAYADMGYQLRNKTTGSQDSTKQGLDVEKKQKGYYEGKKQGYKDAQKFIAKLFAKNLKAEINGKDGVQKQKALQKFLDFCKEGEQDGSKMD